ncbi:MAG: apolipoprotein N-acyltransferase [Planctomycetota bacterium]|jgi:apolipoprotein N-acyltransferase
MELQLKIPVKPRVDVILICLSASFLILIFPGFEIHWLAWIALVPLLLLIKRSGLRRAFLSSLAVGFLFYSGLLWWTLRIDGFNPANLILVLLGSACYFGMFGLFAHYFQKKIPRWNALALPATWVLLEYLRTHLGFLSVPCGILGYSQYSVLPVAQISVFTGVYGVSFLIVAVNTVLAEIIHPYLFPTKGKGFRGAPSPITQKASAGILVGTLLLFSASYLYGLPSPADKGNTPDLKVALIQGNTYWDEKNYSSYRNYAKTTFRIYSRLTLDASDSGPDLIAWPSSSVPGRIPYDRMLVKLLSKLAQETGAFLLVGSSGYDKFSRKQRRVKGVANSAFLLSPHGKIVGRYDKIQLVPFNEYLPLRGYVKWPSWIASSDMTDFRPGKELTVFSMNRHKFGVLICSENMFPELFRKMAAQGVDFMVSMTNEAFMDIPAAHYQILAMNVFRAIENHVSIVRTAPTGISSIIEPTGRITARVQDHNSNDINVEGYLVKEIPLSSERTFYNRHGDWFVYGLFVMFIGFVSLALIRKTHPTRDRSE